MTIKFLMIAFFLVVTSTLNAKYITMVNKTDEATVGVETEIFFGPIKEYQKERKAAMDAIAKKGAEGALAGLSSGAGALAKGMIGEGLNSGLAGGGIGIVYGLLNDPIMSLYDDQTYILVKKIGNTGELKASFFEGDRHPDLSEKEIHNILNRL